MRSLLSCLLLMVAANVSADSEYWVSVASTTSLEEAETLQSRAQTRLADTFTLQPSATDNGFYYRIVTGPFMDLDTAKQRVTQAKSQGFPQAWVVPVPEETLEQAATDEIPLDVDRAATESGWDGDLDPPELDLPRPMNLKEPERSVNEQAPPGYQLNKLNRDQAAIDWSNPFLLADASNSTVLAAALAAQASADEPPVPTTAAVEVDFHTGDLLVLRQWDHGEASIKVDGVLDEPAWKEAFPVNLMKVIEPETLADPIYDTVVRMFYTKRGIYISFDMVQPADTLVKRLSPRDDGRINRDYVSFTLDTSGKGLYGYWMSLALGDNQVDGTILPERQYSRNWDGAWYGGTTETEKGWSAEFFIPWSQVTMPNIEGVRKIGFYGSRQVAHLNQRWAWPAYPRSQAKFMSVLQPLELYDIDPRQQWSFFPYASLTIDEVDNSNKYKSGFDLFWRPSTNLQLTSTVNPDFGTIEADDVVVNLSAFETFFPEKRLFFLEGREIFQETPRAASGEGNSGPPVTLLNTRRIGAAPIPPREAELFEFIDRETNQLTELYGAAKVTGQLGRFRYGVMTAFEQDTDLRAIDGTKFTAEGKDYGIARVLYENTAGGEYRALGFMSTVTAHTETDAYTNGLDYHYLSATGQWKLDGEFLQSYRDDDGNGFGGFAELVYTPRTGSRYVMELSHFDDHLEINDLGFLERNDVTGFAMRAQWIFTEMDGVRDFQIEPFVRYEENGEGEAVKSGIGVSTEIKLNNLNEVTLAARYFPERYDDRNSFDNGTYKIQARPSFGFGYETDTARQFSYFVEGQWEEDGVDGQFYSTKAGFSWRPWDQLSLQLSTSYKVRDGWLLHSEGPNMTSYDSEEWGPKVELEYFLTAKQEFLVAFQWVGIKAFEDKYYQIPESSGDLIEIDRPDVATGNFAVSSLSFQARYRWQIAPLSDLFVVYSRAANDALPINQFSEVLEESWLNPLINQLVVKLRYRLGS